MKFTELADVSDEENLYAIEKHGYAELYDTINGFLGNFELWHDETHNNDVYFLLNNKKIFFDNITIR
jgi:hypothetical protein